MHYMLLYIGRLLISVSWLSAVEELSKFLFTYQLSQRKFTSLEGHAIKSMRPIFKTKIFVGQSKVNLDEKILFGKITHL